MSFTDEERLIGEAAKNQAAMNPRNTIFDIKYAIRLEYALSSYTDYLLGDWLVEGLMILLSRKISSHGRSR